MKSNMGFMGDLLSEKQERHQREESMTNITKPSLLC